ncbi:MAG: hypothetical protein QW802_02905 [Candidatus Altiarchaeota archaeon]
MHFIKAIFLKEFNASIHEKFIRYGRGEFPGPVILIEKDNKKIKLSGSVDYVNIVGRIISEFSNQCKCSGKIISKADIEKSLREIVDIIKVKKSRLQCYEIKGSYLKDDLLKLYDNFFDAYFLFDLKSDNKEFSMKTKKNLPKPGKFDENFFNATLGINAQSKVSEEIAFDVESFDKFNKVKISHIYFIKKLIVPEGLKDNFKEARIKAKREGIIRRIIETDFGKTQKEIEFSV